MLISALENLAIKIFEAGQRKFFSSARQKIVSSPDLYIGKSPRPYNPQEEEPVFLPPCNRGYILGGSGSGKTNLIENCIKNCIVQNRGMIVLDAHGDLSEKLVIFIASLWQKKTEKQKEEIARRLVLVEPFCDKATGFNPLEAASEKAIYSSALGLMSVFERRWDLGARSWELFRNSLVTLSANGLTLLELPLLLTNRELRDSLVKNVTNQEIKSYWLDRYKLSPANEIQWISPILNKATTFLADENVRYMLGQTKTTLDFREAMDEGKWVILNLSKGQLANSMILGGLCLAKLQLAALSRANVSPYHQRPHFFAYIDEFQNFVNAKDGADIETLLSESRKYNLHMAAMAHQNLAQLDGSLLNSILANVNVLFCFRLSYKDALVLAPELDPLDKNVICNNLIKLKTGEAYFKLKGNQPRLVRIPLSSTPYVHPKVVAEFKKQCLSFSTRPLDEVKNEIEERHRKLKTKNNAANNNYRSNKENPSEGQNEW